MLKLRDIAKKSLIGEPVKIATALAGFDNSYRFDNQNVLVNFNSTILFHLLHPIVTQELAVHRSSKLIVQYHVILSKLHAFQKDILDITFENVDFINEIAEPYLTAKSRKILAGTNISSVAEEIHQEMNKKIGGIYCIKITLEI